MSDTFVIRRTTNSVGSVFTIPPNNIDGVGSHQRHTDLQLYGLGINDWGAGVNQNLVRILENFSCPQKEDGDYFNGVRVYDSSIDPIMPKSEHDLGLGFGINKPIVGQVWHNSTTDKLYVYTNNLEWSDSPFSTGGGTAITVTIDETSATTTYPLFSSIDSGTLEIVNTASSKLNFVPSTGRLSATQFNSLSDLSVKTNIQQLQDVFKKLNMINGYEFDFIESGVHSMGVIAQEVEQIAPFLVETDPSGRKTVNYSGLIGLLIESTKLLNERVCTLENNMNSLIRRIEQLETE